MSSSSTWFYNWIALAVAGAGVIYNDPGNRWFFQLVLYASLFAMAAQACWMFWRRTHRKFELPDPTTIGFIAQGAALLAILVACISFAYAIWWGRPENRPVAPIVVNPIPSPPRVSFNAVPLVPNLPPPVPNNEAEVVSRYVQLKALIEQATEVKERLKGNAAAWEEFSIRSNQPSSDPGTGPRRASAGKVAQVTRGQWQMSIETLKRLNATAYANRIFDAETVPELENPLLKAPNEEAFGP